jgi:hypothetical protein
MEQVSTVVRTFLFDLPAYAGEAVARATLAAAIATPIYFMPASFDARRRELLPLDRAAADAEASHRLERIDAVVMGCDPLLSSSHQTPSGVHNLTLTMKFQQRLKLLAMCHFGTVI